VGGREGAKAAARLSNRARGDSPTSWFGGAEPAAASKPSWFATSSLRLKT